MPPTALEKLVSEREAIADALELLDDLIKDNAVNPLTLVDINNSIAEVTELRSKLDDVHTKIRTQAPPDIADHVRDYRILKSSVRTIHNALHGIQAALPVAATTSTSTRSQEIRLPQLELKHFDGNLLEWISFRDLFKSAVHDSTSLSKIQKMTYLQSLLKGEAAKQVQSMILSDANYDTAWQQLHDRYQNEREILFAIMRRLHNQNCLQPTASSLRSLIDTTKECLRSLEIINLKADKPLEASLLFTLTTKLDHSSRELWELSLKGNAIPPLQDLFDFLEQRARALAAGGPQKPPPSNRKQEENPHRRVHAHHGNTSNKCKLCNDGFHPLYKCSKFNSLSVAERFELTKKFKLCGNCLQENHFANKCTSSSRCRTCGMTHHTLLHKVAQNATPAPSPPAQPLVLGHHARNNSKSSTILATAIIAVFGYDGLIHLCRALLDGGASSCFITELCLYRLGLSRTRNTAEVVGLAAAPVGTARGVTSLVFSPHHSYDTKYTVNALVLPKITDDLPMYACDKSTWSHLEGLTLADPNFHNPGAIDILLGADIFYDLLEGGSLAGLPGTPLAIGSSLGWLVAGAFDGPPQQVRVHYSDCDLDKQLEKFWELENVPTHRILTPEESNCEAHFASTHTRDETGRFTVAIPWKEPRPALGPSRDLVLKQMKSLERRLVGKPEYQQQYLEFMKEYLTLGHMVEVPHAEILRPLHPTSYLPYHFVLKEESTTTKFRMVFNASMKTSSGNSLNDLMMVGPTLQDNLVDLIMRFRLHPIAFTADIAKMYRQIRVTPADADLQRILWRESPTEEVKEYRLETVTYGTASAPYLAVKCLQQLAEDEKESLPLASAIAKDDGYVDDIMSGSRSVEEVLEIQRQLLELTTRGGFTLRKWCSNSPEVLEALPEELRESHPNLSLSMDHSVKTLGIIWNTTQDRFEFKYNDDGDSNNPVFSKRRVLSEMSSLWDPPGYVSPCIVKAKILMQSLWKMECKWDDHLPHDIQTFWKTYKKELKNVDQIFIPRCVIPSAPERIDIVGFSDASEKAYAACVYIKVKSANSIDISLLSSKSRVAPAKQISLPRLELCGCLLLSQLIPSVQKALKIEISSVSAYSDSTVALAWIKAHPSRWKTFVANRVTKVQENLPGCVWNHVAGVDNPADLPSRGCTPTELKNSSLWWNGPEFLRNPSSYSSPEREYTEEELNQINSEEKKIVMVNFTQIKLDLSLLNRFSSMTQLLRVTSWILRFHVNAHPCAVRRFGPITAAEIENSLQTWIKLIQQQEFGMEIDLLLNKNSLPFKNRLLPLNPFVDSNGVLRVGGRLRHAKMSPDQKTPILLPRHSKFTELLIISKHKQHLHAGPNLMLAILQQRFWVVRARDAVRFLVRKCVVCMRHAATTQQQFMGDLPPSRVNPCRAFKQCGVDYAGPFLLKPDVKRSKTTFKAYLALFVCFTTRAFHLELVSSLSTDAFLASLRRFVARRGRPSDIHSDCGTNFVGASRELGELKNLVHSSEHNHKVTDNLSSDGISWHFNPPGAPHFGGLWEAGVKSVKYHLHRILGSTRLTFEEMTTTIAQVEACLNSRPLTPFSSDPSDLAALTSGHFLIGEPLLSIPEPDLTKINQNKLSRWQLIQSLQQQFWKRWSQEFLTRLQQRPKWMNHRKDLKIDDLVIIKDENLPPQAWKLARVIALHPGSDGIVRVVTLKTVSGDIKRPIHKLCLLPINSESASDDCV